MIERPGKDGDIDPVRRVRAFILFIRDRLDENGVILAVPKRFVRKSDRVTARRIPDDDVVAQQPRARLIAPYRPRPIEDRAGVGGLG